MQSIINHSGFGFCKASSFRNCNNCLYRLRCINYAPVYSNNIVSQETLRLRSNETFDLTISKREEDLTQENFALKQKIQDLESQILLLNQSKNIDNLVNLQPISTEEPTSALQVYENKNLEVSQQSNVPLKAKKGIFGTKYVEDNPKKK